MSRFNRIVHGGLVGEFRRRLSPNEDIRDEKLPRAIVRHRVPRSALSTGEILISKRELKSKFRPSSGNRRRFISHRSFRVRRRKLIARSRQRSDNAETRDVARGGTCIRSDVLVIDGKYCQERIIGRQSDIDGDTATRSEWPGRRKNGTLPGTKVVVVTAPVYAPVGRGILVLITSID